MNLLQLFDLSLVNRRDAVALEWGGGTFTFGEIERRSNRAANALRARGLAKGDRLCVYLANRIELIDIFLACVKLGVIFVPINILYRDRERSHILQDADPYAVVSTESFAAPVPLWTPGELTGEAAAIRPRTIGLSLTANYGK